jgi:hypothetical protein
MTVIECPHCIGQIDVTDAAPGLCLCPHCEGQVRVAYRHPSPEELERAKALHDEIVTASKMERNAETRSTARIERDWVREIASLFLFLVGLLSGVVSLFSFQIGLLFALVVIIVAVFLSYRTLACSECRNRVRRGAKVCASCHARFSGKPGTLNDTLKVGGAALLMAIAAIVIAIIVCVAFG